jgi:uncharacterized protein (DUF2236 family)
MGLMFARSVALGDAPVAPDRMSEPDLVGDLDLARDPGLYGPASQAWRLNREAALLLGAGPRALLMQIAHPLVAEGVAQHSDFRVDPWGRLRATLRSYLTIVYGSTGQARSEIRRLNRLHRSISGPILEPAAAATFGGSYAARDPELSLWVHATLIDATLVVNERWVGPLVPSERAQFYAETRPIGRAFGVPEALLPTDIEAFERYLAEMIGATGPVQVGPTARELAGTILRPPLGPLHPRLAGIPAGLYAWTMWPAVGLLPESIREGYGLPWGAGRRLVAAWLTTGYRSWRPVLPVGFRSMPWALRADARLDPSGHDAAPGGPVW